MLLFRFLFDVYVKASFHVALMVLCFYEITHFEWDEKSVFKERVLVFSLAFLGYNLIKYYPFSKKIVTTPWLYKVLLPSAVLAFIFSFYAFFFSPLSGQLLLLLCFLLCLAYAIPISAAIGNLRSQFGLKIFIVALCWTLLTAVFPLVDLTQWNGMHYLFFGERFVLVFVATLPFEIRDMAKDQKALGTIPQLIGVVKTRYLGSILLLLLLGRNVFFHEAGLGLPIALILMGSAYFVALFRVQAESSENITLFGWN